MKPAELAAQKSAQTAPAAMPNFGGAWTNELGSEMNLTVSGNKIGGTYTSKVSGGGGSTPSKPLAGFKNGDLIAFVVNWETPYNSLTAWVGQHTKEDGAEVIKTLWHLTQNVEDADEPTGLWHSILAGADEFRRK
jgi:Avidin family